MTLGKTRFKVTVVTTMEYEYSLEKYHDNNPVGHGGSYSFIEHATLGDLLENVRAETTMRVSPFNDTWFEQPCYLQGAHRCLWHVGTHKGRQYHIDEYTFEWAVQNQYIFKDHHAHRFCLECRRFWVFRWCILECRVFCPYCKMVLAGPGCVSFIDNWLFGQIHRRRSYCTWLPDEILMDVAGLFTIPDDERFFMKIYYRHARRGRIQEEPEDVLASSRVGELLTLGGDVETNPGPEHPIGTHIFGIKACTKCLSHIEDHHPNLQEPFLRVTSCTMRHFFPYSFIFLVVHDHAKYDVCRVCNKNLLRLLNNKKKEIAAKMNESDWVEDLTIDGDIESNPGPREDLHRGALSDHLTRHIPYSRDRLERMMKEVEKEPAGTHCCRKGGFAEDGNLIPHAINNDCDQRKSMTYAETRSWLAYFFPPDRMAAIFPSGPSQPPPLHSAEEHTSDDDSQHTERIVHTSERKSHSHRKRRPKFERHNLKKAMEAHNGKPKEEDPETYRRTMLNTCPRDFRIVLAMRSEITMGSGLLDSFSFLAKQEWVDFWEKLDYDLWPCGLKRLVIGWRGFYDAGGYAVTPCLAGRDCLDTLSPYKGSGVDCDYVLGPLPYSNRIGFFFDECWTEDHYNELAAKGYGPLHMSGEFCVYAKDRPMYRVAERYSFYLAERSALMKGVWFASEHTHIPILIDTEAPFVYTNGVWMHDGSYVTANRQLGSTSFSYVKHWSWLVQGTCLFQAIRNNAHNLQKINVYTADSHYQQIFGSWFATSSVADCIWRSVFKTRTMTNTAHQDFLNDHDAQHPGPEPPPPPPRRSAEKDALIRFSEKVKDISLQTWSNVQDRWKTWTAPVSPATPSTQSKDDREDSQSEDESQWGETDILVDTEGSEADDAPPVLEEVKHVVAFTVQQIAQHFKKVEHDLKYCELPLPDNPNVNHVISPLHLNVTPSEFTTRAQNLHGFLSNERLSKVAISFLGWYFGCDDDSILMQHVLQERQYPDSPGVEFELQHSSLCTMPVQTLFGPASHDGMPILRQAATHAYVDGVAYSFSEEPPYDFTRLSVTFEPGHDWFTASLTSARPEVLYHVYYGDLFIPNPSSSLWTLVYRMGKTGLVANKTAMKRYRRFWSRLRKCWVRDVDWRDDGMETTTFKNFLATLEEMAPAKKRRHLEWAAQYMMGLHRWNPSLYRLFAKLDEATNLEYAAEYELDEQALILPLNGKPRHLLSVTPHDMFCEQGLLKDIKCELKRTLFGLPEAFHFPIENAEGMLLTHVHLIYGADMDNIQESEWYTRSRAEEGVHLLVGGDDNATVINLRDLYIEIEGDISMCDQSHNEDHRDEFLTVCADNGMNLRAIQSMKENYTANVVYFKGRERVATVTRDCQLTTGSTKTSFANTVTVGKAIVYLLHQLINEACKTNISEDHVNKLFKEESEKLGLKVKVKSWINPSFPRLTYHKRYFVWSDKGRIYTSCPLPGSTLKKMLKVLAPTLCSRARYLQLLAAVARSRWPCSNNPICRVVMEQLHQERGVFQLNPYKQINDDPTWLDRVGDGRDFHHIQFMEATHGITEADYAHLMSWASRIRLDQAQNLINRRTGQLLHQLWAAEQW